MTNEDVIRLAREAGLCHDINNGIYLCAPMHLERFAKLVAAAEREACAKACDAIDKSHWGCEVKASWCSDAIRARGSHGETE